MRVIFFLYLFSVFGSLCAQSSFDFKVLSSEYRVINVYYNGRLGAVAGTDTTRLDPFNFISVGKLKQSSAISNGYVYAMLTYRDKQLVVIESAYGACCEPSDWAPVGNVDSLPFSSILGKHIDSGDRRSFFKELDQCRIYLLNIREDNVSLFQWMMTTLKFD